MRRWSIKGYSTAARNFYGDLTPEQLANPEQRFDPVIPKDRKGRILDPIEVASARIDAEHNEPNRVFIQYVTDTGQVKYVWIYLEDWGDSWSEVNWSDIMEYIGERYHVGPPPRPEPEIEKEAPPKRKPRKKKKPLPQRALDFLKRIFRFRR